MRARATQPPLPSHRRTGVETRHRAFRRRPCASRLDFASYCSRMVETRLDAMLSFFCAFCSLLLGLSQRPMCRCGERCLVPSPWTCLAKGLAAVGAAPMWQRLRGAAGAAAAAAAESRSMLLPPCLPAGRAVASRRAPPQRQSGVACHGCAAQAECLARRRAHTPPAPAVAPPPLSLPSSHPHAARHEPRVRLVSASWLQHVALPSDCARQSAHCRSMLIQPAQPLQAAAHRRLGHRQVLPAAALCRRHLHRELHLQ
jgi:hypothetical protein